METSKKILIRNALLWLATLGIVLLSHGTIFGATGDRVVLDIIPSPIQLAPGEKVTGLVVAHNQSAEILTDLTLTSIDAAAILITIEPIETSSRSPLEPDGEKAWRFTVTRSDRESITRTTYFRLSYRYRGSKGQIIARDALAPLTLQAYSFTSLKKIASARIETTLNLLQEQRDNFLYLIVTNLSNIPIQIEGLKHHQPNFLELKLLDNSQTAISSAPFQPIPLAPQSSQIFSFQAKAQNAVQAGRELVMFDIALSWEERHQLRTGTLIATHQFDANIVGESEILKLMGIPLFFLIPGVLILLVYKSLWNRSTPNENFQETLDILKPTFLIIAIPLSLFLTLMYPTLSGWLGDSRNLLVAYGLQDIFNIWIFSLLIGFLARVIVVVCRFGWDRWQEQRERDRHIQQDKELIKRTPARGDSVESVLQKLGQAIPDQNLILPPITHNGKRYYVACEDPKDSKQVWIISPIRFKMTDKAGQEYLDRFNKLKDEGTFKDLAKLIEEDSKQKDKKERKVQLTWRYDSPTRILGPEGWKGQAGEDFFDEWVDE
ncbi:hypothetical protein [Microcystis sp. M061S2]|uniref:hypothetical protein n=1 Tax=Microcystis sp. M061S2 TaxID=2771171 RepID=UPI00258F6872|nr:hypothetical protein [Microcystis sp. M061S2]MCA2652701.1 hypothetical protein [Microcystis sp. M061S2]